MCNLLTHLTFFGNHCIMKFLERVWLMHTIPNASWSLCSSTYSYTTGSGSLTYARHSWSLCSATYSYTAGSGSLTYARHSWSLCSSTYMQLYCGIGEFWSSNVFSNSDSLVQLLSLSGRRWRYTILNLTSFSSFISDIFYSAWYSCPFHSMMCHILRSFYDILWRYICHFNYWCTFQSIFCGSLFIPFTLYFIYQANVWHPCMNCLMAVDAVRHCYSQSPCHISSLLPISLIPVYFVRSNSFYVHPRSP